MRSPSRDRIPPGDTRLPVATWLIAVLGLVLYLWGAFVSTPVQWSDSRIDLAWARSGEGIFLPVIPLPDSAHSVKPFYLAFLKGILLAFPSDPTRAIVVAQSVALYASILLTSLWLGRGRARMVSPAILFVLLFFLRTRDSASAVMPEALATALLLPLCAALLQEFRSRWATFLFGIGCGLLWLVRPNLGLLVFLLLFVRTALTRQWLKFAVVFVTLLLILLPSWVISRSWPIPSTGRLSFSVLEGSADYLWRPSLANPPSSSEAEFEAARKNWSRLLSRFDSDARRQLAWRALHGLFGGEYYDARWAPAYRVLDVSARIASPFLIALAIGVLFGRPFTGPDQPLNVLAPLLVVALIGQGFLVGALPRYVLPALPVLLAMGVLGVFGIRRGSPRQMVPAVVAVLAILLTIAAVPGIADGERWKRPAFASYRKFPGALSPRQDLQLFTSASPPQGSRPRRKSPSWGRRAPALHDRRSGSRAARVDDPFARLASRAQSKDLRRNLPRIFRPF